MPARERPENHVDTLSLIRIGAISVIIRECCTDYPSSTIERRYSDAVEIVSQMNYLASKPESMGVLRLLRLGLLTLGVLLPATTTPYPHKRGEQ